MTELNMINLILSQNKYPPLIAVQEASQEVGCKSLAEIQPGHPEGRRYVLAEL